MDVRTYRAASIQDALRLVWRDLGPDAAVLHTREVSRGLLAWFSGGRQIEVTASVDVQVPSRLPPEDPNQEADLAPPLQDDPLQDDPRPDMRRMDYGESALEFPPSPIPGNDRRIGDEPSADRLGLKRAGLELAGLDLAGLELDRLAAPEWFSRGEEPPQAFFQVFAELIDAELSEELARELVDELRSVYGHDSSTDSATLRAAMSELVESRIEAGGAIQVTPGRRRVVALVGPTGVGKTTTIAKLAANFHLRQQTRVGLITVDTYRIAAVEQLRTYADIIDLPMEVVSTPREMRQAVDRFADLDLVLLDTAGRSPRDEVRIQELKSMLAEARADEVHLVLSSVASLSALKKTAQRFARVGTTALLLTKLDEATGLGNLLPLLADCRLPLSYVTHGQNVPDDITAAVPNKLAQFILSCDSQQVL